MFLLLDIRGIMDSKLISRPIHILIQEYDEIAINVPIIKKFMKMTLFNLKIKKKRIKTFINGV